MCIHTCTHTHDTYIVVHWAPLCRYQNCHGNQAAFFSSQCKVLQNILKRKKKTEEETERTCIRTKSRKKRIHQSPYHFSSTKSKGILKEFFHVFLLHQLSKLSVVIYFRKICITRTILVLIPECNKLLVKEIPSLFYCLQNPNFIWLNAKFTSAKNYVSVFLTSQIRKKETNVKSINP